MPLIRQDDFITAVADALQYISYFHPPDYLRAPYTQPVWVFSSRPRAPVPGADIRFVRGDVRPVHAEMAAAAGDKNIWIVGGGDLAGQFYNQGLLDEIVVQVGSVTLGADRPLLPRAIVSPPLRLRSVRQVGTGFAELHYEVPRRT